MRLERELALADRAALPVPAAMQAAHDAALTVGDLGVLEDLARLPVHAQGARREAMGMTLASSRRSSSGRANLYCSASDIMWLACCVSPARMSAGTKISSRRYACS